MEKVSLDQIFLVHVLYMAGKHNLVIPPALLTQKEVFMKKADRKAEITHGDKVNRLYCTKAIYQPGMGEIGRIK